MTLASVPDATTLLDRLPPVRGRLRSCVPLGALTWFRVGGPAEVMFRPADQGDLMQFLRWLPPEIPVTTLGVGSNILVRDGGIAGVSVRLGGPLASIRRTGDTLVVGAGVLDSSVALAAAAVGLGGLEFLSGVPGTIGGGLRMNAGAYGGEMRGIVVAAEAVDRAGDVHELCPDDFGFGYRECRVPDDWIFTSAILQGTVTDPAVVSERLAKMKARRESTQPIRERTGGSTFKNAAGSGRPVTAWKLVRDAGCSGMRRGRARVSELHANFLINEGGATAADVEALGLDVAQRVLAATGVVLDWEIRRLGGPAGERPAGCPEAN